MRHAILAALVVVLSGCDEYERAAEVVSEKMCSPAGETARNLFRTARDAEFRQKDQALCGRCPGEERLQCTGDPKGLPE